MKQRINSLFALRTIRLTASSILAAMFLLVLPVAIHAQQAENPRVISYQGTVTTSSGSQVTGDHLITMTLYSDAEATQAVWSGTYNQQITGGVFTVLLGSGAYPLPVAQDFSKTLWIGVKIDGGEELKPLTQLTGAPYSVSIADKSVTKDKIAVDYVGSIMVNGKRITGKGTTINLVDGLNTSLLYDESTNSLSLNSTGGISNPKPQNAVGPWNNTGDALTSGGITNQTFGSTDAADVIMIANGSEQMRMMGQQGGGAATLGLSIPTTVNTGQGVVYQNITHTYIHSFGGVTNFFAGNDAGNLTMPATSTDNTGIGYQALNQNTGGGSLPQYLGTQNTAIGSGALSVNTTGWMNTASGYWALWKNIDGNKNTASGACALELHLHGSGNTASGWGAMTSGTTGEWNTGTGVDALHDNTGDFNAAFGTAALQNNQTGWDNTAIGTGALQNNLTGWNNTASGFKALFNNTASDNTADGDSALYSNTSGYSNTASGKGALFSNTTGLENTATGEGALYYNTIGYVNTASGDRSLYYNTTGYANTAYGFQTLALNTTGTLNTAIGYQTLYSNTTGLYNTASGILALFSNSTGQSNVADGNAALYNNIAGNNNTASGTSALFSTTGSSNTGSGYQAGQTNTTGSNNTFVGNQADASANNLTNASAIGNGAIVSANNTIELGNTGVTAISTHGHIVTQSTIGAATPDGAVITVANDAGSDVAGTVTVTSAPGALGTVKVSFGTTYGTAPIVVITPASANAILVSGFRYYVTSTATDFTINFSGTTIQTNAVFNYIVIH